MKCMILGAVINTVLDPVFIFGLHMGVVGGRHCHRHWTGGGRRSVPGLSAAASVGADSPGLAASTAALTGRIFKLGIPSFLTQIMTAAVQVTMNNLMTRYGAQTPMAGMWRFRFMAW